MKRDEEAQASSTNASGCFLCGPPEDLVYWRSDDGQALCGLGPLVDGYSVVATTVHIRSAADAAYGDAPRFLSFTEMVRARLIKEFGSCTITEHGRMPVCADLMMAERHCFHAHFLAFPNAPPIEDLARGYFDAVEEAPSLPAVLYVARRYEEYFLLSAEPNRFLIMTSKRPMPRQFARALVASRVGKQDRTSWRAHADLEAASSSAGRLRGLFARAASG